MFQKKIFKNLDSAFVIQEEDRRKVLRLDFEGKKYLVKEHQLQNLREKIYATFHVKRWRGYRELLNEYYNLIKANTLITNTPKLREFYTKRNIFGIADKQYIATDFLENCFTSEVLLKDPSVENKKVLEKIAISFKASLDRGFMHLDPHPGNMMLDKNIETLWFIDLECSDFNIYNKDIACGFLCGHFFHYYARRFIDLEPYDEIVQETMKPHFKIENDKLFDAIYLLYRDSHVKKRVRFSHFLSKEKSNELVKHYS